MRTLAVIFLCFTLSSCGVMLVTGDDLELFCHSRIYKPLMLPKEVADAHPRMYRQFLKALDRWELSVPVDFDIIDSIWGPKSSNSVVFGNFISLFDPTGKDILGFFNPETHIIFFNEEMEIDIENFPDDAIYKTCLHELGHVLGLPHIIGKIGEDGHSDFEFGGGFDIVLPTQEEAKKCIMFPMSSNKNQTDLSPIEILWARHALMHDLNLTSSLGECNYE